METPAHPASAPASYGDGPSGSPSLHTAALRASGIPSGLRFRGSPKFGLPSRLRAGVRGSSEFGFPSSFRASVPSEFGLPSREQQELIDSRRAQSAPHSDQRRTLIL